MNRRVEAYFLTGALLLLGILSLAQLPGCGGGDGGSIPVGNLQVAITDSPAFRDFSSVHIRIDKVMVVPKGKESAPDTDPGLMTVATFPGGVDVNIMKLHFLQQVLGSALIPPGTYNQVRLILAPNPATAPFNNYFILAGNNQPPVALTTPSAQESGVKINGHFTVTMGVLNAILLEFNPNEAIVKRGVTGEANLKPTGIRIVQVFSSLANAGSISGLIHTPAFNLHSSATFKPWSSAMVSIVPRTPAAGAISSGVVFSNFSSPDVWKAPFVAYVPPNGSTGMPSANYKVFVQAFRDTKLSTPTFQLFSSSLMTVTAANQDFQVPPNGIITLKP